jgi:hypothetical protein
MSALDIQPVFPGEPASPAGLITMLLIGLLICMLGYTLFRLELAAVGLWTGVMLGAMLVEWRFSEPRGVDYLVISLSAGIVLALAAWFFYRLAFGVWVLGFVGVVAVLLLANATDSALDEVWLWVAGGLAGLLPAYFALKYTRGVFIVLSAIGGAAGAVGSGYTLVFGTEATPSWVQWTVIAALWMALAYAGIRVQQWLTTTLRTAFTPEAVEEKKRIERCKADAKPKFAKV